MAGRIIILLLLCASQLFAGERYLIIGINSAATSHDKIALMAVINKYLDADYKATMTITIRKTLNPTIEARIGCWDVEKRKFPFTKTQAQNYFINHAADFDDVTDIKIMASDDPWQTIADNGWEKKPE